MSVAASARIDLAALRHNLSQARNSAPNSRVMAVVKANGYGHGMLQVAAALGDADGLAVARVDEAEALRAGGVDKPLLVLEGFREEEDLEAMGKHGLASVIHSEEQLASLEAAGRATERPLSVWLKIDTGMHRLGFPAARLPELRQRISQLPGVVLDCLMTHFACADERENPATERQIADFCDAAADVSCARSLANSAGLLGWPASHAEWVRPGLMLYGVSPFAGGTAADDGLRPVMTFTSSLIAINEVEPGGRVGYGGTWTSVNGSRVGVVAAGYGDGYPRTATNGTPALVNGSRAPLVGRVSMDMLTVDLSALPDAAVGDEVIFWGDGLPVEEVAAHAGTVPYALLCGVTARTRFTYVGARE